MLRYSGAGYTAKGNAAESAAARLLRNVQAQAYLTDITQDMVPERYWSIACSEMLRSAPE
jgi:phage terminase small subunit